MHWHCQPGKILDPERCWKIFDFLQSAWRSFVPSTRKAATSRIRILLLLEKMIGKTHSEGKGGGAEKCTGGKERFAQQHKIKICKKHPYGLCSLTWYSSQHLPESFFWKENIRASTWKRRIKAMKADTTNQWVNPNKYCMVRNSVVF